MERISTLAHKIQEREQKKRKLADKLRSGSLLSEIAEARKEVAESGTSVIKSVTPDSLKDKAIAGVDGGLQSRQLQGVDIILTRAVGALFEFNNGSLHHCSYLPEKNPQPRADLGYRPLRRSELSVKRSLLRLKSEISVAISILDEKPDLLLLDGSLFPQSRDRPQSGSEIETLYQKVIELYERFYRKAGEKEVLVAGAVEDSRSSRFVKLLKEESDIDQKLIDHYRDTDFLSTLLRQGERTFAINYTQEQNQHPVLRQLDYTGDMYSFYLKPVANDQPLRIDFRAQKPRQLVDKLASLILPLSTFNANYAIPSVIIEADQRAKIGEKDLESYEKMLKARTGFNDSLRPMRRNKRPFA